MKSMKWLVKGKEIRVAGNGSSVGSFSRILELVAIGRD